MKQNKCFSILGILLWGMLSLISCSSDDDKYTSESPRFSDITFSPLDESQVSLEAGKPFVATAIQGLKGKLLNTTYYAWSVANANGITHKYKSNVIYDANSEHPTDTISVPTAGIYTLTFTAEYNVSGIAKGVNFFESPSTSFSANYQASPLKFKVQLTKKFVVR